MGTSALVALCSCVMIGVATAQKPAPPMTPYDDFDERYRDYVLLSDWDGPGRGARVV